MSAPIDNPLRVGIFPMTPARHDELQRCLASASEEMTLALRRGGSPQRYRDLSLLVMALDAARQVLAASGALHR